MDHAARVLPCEYCRAMERHAQTLSGVRIGKLERHLLLTAKAEEYQILSPASPGRSSTPALRRAIRKLSEAGLLWSWSEDKEVETQHLAGRDRPSSWARPGAAVQRKDWHRAVHLSPLGTALVEKLGEQLAGGQRIRWDRWQGRLRDQVRRPTKALLREFHAAVEQGAKRWAESMRISVQLGSRKGAMEEREKSAALGLVATACQVTLRRYAEEQEGQEVEA